MSLLRRTRQKLMDSNDAKIVSYRSLNAPDKPLGNQSEHNQLELPNIQGILRWNVHGLNGKFGSRRRHVSRHFSIQARPSKLVVQMLTVNILHDQYILYVYTTYTLCTSLGHPERPKPLNYLRGPVVIWT